MSGTKSCIVGKGAILARTRTWRSGLKMVKDQLPAVEGLGATGDRGAFDSADAMHGFEGIASKPVLRRLGLEVLQ